MKHSFNSFRKAIHSSRPLAADESNSTGDGFVCGL